MIRFELCTHISNRLLHKTVPAFFLTMNYSFFITITRWVLKAHFAWKLLKVDYSKNILKEENRGHCYVCLLVGYMSVKKNYWNCNSVRAGAHKVGKVVTFFAQPWSYFYLERYLERVKRVNYIYWKMLLLA